MNNMHPLATLHAGLWGALGPATLLILPAFAAFLLASAHEQTRTYRRDYGLTAMFFIIGFVIMLTVITLGGAGGTMGRVLAGVLLFMWGMKLFSGYQLRLMAADDPYKVVDDWPLSAMMGIVAGAALSFGWAGGSGSAYGNLLLYVLQNGSQAAVAPVLGYVLGLSTILVVLALVLWPLARRWHRNGQGRGVEKWGGAILCVLALGLMFGGIGALCGWLEQTFTTWGRLG